jgi:alkylhydroperoxidase/carboxymuconolactone decarboxylase family protein YurZ
MAFDDRKVREYLQATHETPFLTEREKHLIGLAVTMTRGCQVCTRGRIERARSAGIGDDLLNALVGIVSAVNAGVTAATAREAFRLAAETSEQQCGTLCSPEAPVRRSEGNSAG